jgi:hypothetical protein
MSEPIERRLTRLEARAEIQELVARYCFTIDDRDLEGAARLFTDDAVVRSLDGVMNATGIAAIIDQYRHRFEVLGVSNHVVHQVQIDMVSEDEARGRVSSHAELWRNGRMMITALQYADRYRRTREGWRFAERVLSFLYYIPVEQYARILGERDRNRAYAQPLDADYPERLPTWTS